MMAGVSFSRWGKVASGGGKVKEEEISNMLYHRSGMFGKEGRTCPFRDRGFVMETGS